MHRIGGLEKSGETGAISQLLTGQHAALGGGDGGLHQDLLGGQVAGGSIAKRIDIRADNAALRKEIKTYDDRYKQDSLRLDRMKNDPDALIRVARESHRMCASDEDVYIVTEE